MRNSMIASLFVLSLTALPAVAQQAPAGVEVTASQPARKGRHGR
jgi:hypothetical protein